MTLGPVRSCKRVQAGVSACRESVVLVLAGPNVGRVERNGAERNGAERSGAERSGAGPPRGPRGAERDATRRPPCRFRQGPSYSIPDQLQDHNPMETLDKCIH
jgi:hypothetical protein